MLEGKIVNLRRMEKEDLPLVAAWFNNPEFLGEHEGLFQFSKSEFETLFATENSHESAEFFIEKKDGTKIGIIVHFYVMHVDPSITLLEFGYFMLPSERGRGYCTEAAHIMVDYLFLSKQIMRIQATTSAGNLASQKVLEKVGFRNEGTMRKSAYIRGEWRDDYLYSILREEWKEPRILTKLNTQQ